MIIDAHTQFGPRLVDASPFQPAVKASSADDIVALLNRTGIDRGLVSPPRWFQMYAVRASRGWWR